MKQLVRAFLNKCGIEIRLVKNMHAQLRDAFLEQQRLVGKKDVKVVFDIGAYDGGTALKYKEYFPNATVYSFEPFAATYSKLLNTANKHSFIKPINAAVAEKVGHAILHVNSMDATNSLLPSETTNSYLDDLTKSVDRVEVQTTTVDYLCEEKNIDCIDVLKIDVQGNGLAVLKGAERMLRDKKIKIIYIEIEFLQIYKGQPLMYELTAFLSGFNYNLFGLYNLVHQKSGQLAWGDAIYYCDELESSIRSMNS
ncbi:MAG TPA: FkbM family methyltransferase [Bacteroidia bacterium]|nr:FkbM family methyltransferase [Bacteroidia bacterium]